MHSRTPATSVIVDTSLDKTQAVIAHPPLPVQVPREAGGLGIISETTFDRNVNQNGRNNDIIRAIEMLAYLNKQR